MIVQWFGPFCDVLSIWLVTSGGIPVSVTVWDMGNQFLWFEPVYEVVLVLFVLFCVILRCLEIKNKMCRRGLLVSQVAPILCCVEPFGR